MVDEKNIQKNLINKLSKENLKEDRLSPNIYPKKNIYIYISKISINNRYQKNISKMYIQTYISNISIQNIYPKNKFKNMRV